jgi:hypothetical protein
MMQKKEKIPEMFKITKLKVMLLVILVPLYVFFLYLDYINLISERVFLSIVFAMSLTLIIIILYRERMERREKTKIQ